MERWNEKRDAMQYIENRTYDELRIGDSAELTRKIQREDLGLFSVVQGGDDASEPERRRPEDGGDVTIHAMWGDALISAVMGLKLPGPGTEFVSQNLTFSRAVGLGDTLQVRVTVAEKRADRHVVLDCLCLDDAGDTVITGKAEVIAPEVKIRRPSAELPEVHLHERGALQRSLLDAARQHKPIRMAVIHPCDARSLGGALAARDAGLIVPVLVGPEKRIRSVAKEEGLDLGGAEIVDAPHSHASASEGVKLAREGRADALMKGKLHTDEIMEIVVDADVGLRTERRITHVFVFDVPHYPKPLFITDAAINIEPDLNTKRDIIQNAIDLARALGNEMPKVAILSAVETVTPAITSSVEAAALCKMADRGQIIGGLVEGPLAFDNAVSIEAVRAKGLVSPVAGQADILVSPDLVSGNMIAKQLVYLAGADIAGVALGAKVPIVLTSRSDDVRSRVASAALVRLLLARS